MVSKIRDYEQSDLTEKHKVALRLADAFIFNFGNIPDVKPEPEMLELAEKLIEQKVKKFDPKDYEDRYEIALMAMIREKLQSACEHVDRQRADDLRKQRGTGAKLAAGLQDLEQQPAFAADPEAVHCVDAAAIGEGFRAYLGKISASDPRVSPNYGDLTKLPPTFIQLGEAEVFAPAALDFATRAKAAGATVEVDIWPEMPHDWHWYAPRLPEAREALQRAGEFITRYMADSRE